MAITPSVLTSGVSGTDGTSVATASVTPTDGRLAVALICGTQTPPATPTCSGNGQTWANFETINWATGASPTRSLTAFSAFVTGAATGTITFDFGAGTQTSFAWIVIEFDGALDIVQSTSKAGTNSSMSNTLVAFNSAADNMAVGVVANVSDASPVTPGSAFLELTEVNNAADPVISFQVEYAQGEQTTVDHSWTTSRQFGSIAFEVGRQIYGHKVGLGSTSWSLLK